MSQESFGICDNLLYTLYNINMFNKNFYKFLYSFVAVVTLTLSLVLVVGVMAT